MTAETGPVVVTGLGVACSIGLDVPSFAESLRMGRSGVTRANGVLVAPLPSFDLREVLGRGGLSVSRRRAVLGAARREPVPVEAALMAVAEAWTAARAEAAVAQDRLGIVVGGHNLTGWYAFEHHDTFVREPAYLPARYALQVQDTDHIGTISEGFGIKGEGLTVGGSSASGGLALLHAYRMVRCGAVDLCVTVGAMTRLAPPERAALAKLGVLADDGPPRPFDRGRSGLVPGEAVACVVLESAEGAARRGVVPLAEIAGAAQALDGARHADPSVSGEVRAMRGALTRAGVAPSDVDYVNAHATATAAGDDAEAAALHEVFGTARPWVNATKALTGHCLASAGVVEAVAAVIQLREGFVHPNPGLEDPVHPWLRLAGEQMHKADLRCALSNSFGFGGINTSIVLRQL